MVTTGALAELRRQAGNDLAFETDSSTANPTVERPDMASIVRSGAFSRHFTVPSPIELQRFLAHQRKAEAIFLI
ncbi:hypothetical protein [Bosea sp. CRIB-10]|uniref:hypothetical protein n=1 Tax=Bosea sp. CRIB-10 TaxID=378404 RepID=UPI000B890E57|nr:hypothetical protein [Bosea sp. CRIB-10]